MNQLEKDFIRYLLADFKILLDESFFYLDLEVLFRHLINIQLITNFTIRHYTVIHAYNETVNSNGHKNKTQAIQFIAKRYGFHPNTIWNILKDYQNKFKQIPSPSCLNDQESMDGSL